ncbi:MAG: amidohydrolase [Proteobacteria bacterium]|nr:amidohydrolase [Pseudomonadota bacterium]
MSKRNRREFLALLGAPALGVAGTAAARAATALHAGIVPDLILVNANVLTIDAALPRAQGFAVKNGRFVAIGRSEDMRALAGRDTEVIDAAGMTVTPGFIDAHCHPGLQDELYDVNCDLPGIAQIQAALRKRAAETAPGHWVRGFKFDDTKLKDGRPLSRQDLDAAVPDHPVAVVHRGGHTAWYNSKAFEIAGIKRDTPDPTDGRFFRDANGDLQGQVAENARTRLDQAGPQERFSAEQQRERSRAAMVYASKLLTAVGLTSVHDAMADTDKIRAYQDTYAGGELLHRATVMPYGMDGLGSIAGGPSPYKSLRSAGVYSGLGNEHVRIGAVKFVADGSASERTMRMSTPYVGRPKDYGILTMDQKQIHEAVEEAHRHGWQVGIHANGDVTIDLVLNAYERVAKLWPRPDQRHRIEHCTLVNPSLIQRIKASGSIPTPFWTYVYYHGEKWKNYGEDKLRWMFAHKSFLDAGIRVPGASDYTPGPFDPLMALQSMVTRTDYAGRSWGPEQKISVEQALQVATINGAYASYEENAKGSITAGKLADFVVLEQDPHAVDPFTLKDIKVMRTVVGGRTVHTRMG